MNSTFYKYKVIGVTLAKLMPLFVGYDRI